MAWSMSTICVLALAFTCGLQVDGLRVRRSNHFSNICSMWGNFHFKTFDGDVYQFQGTCEYNLVSDCHGPVQSFSVHVKRAGIPGTSQIIRVLVTVGDIAIELTKNLVMVNSEIVKLPHYVAGVMLEDSYSYFKLYSKLGLSVTWNRDDAVMLELDSKYSNRTCGLCGDYNGVPVLNEFLSDGRVIGFTEFGNIHSIHSPNNFCEDPFEEFENEGRTFEKCESFREDCSELVLDDPWSFCRNVLSPEPYIQSCMMDMCTSHPGDIDNTAFLCSTLSEYSRQCSHSGGKPPNWRTLTFCAMTCPFNMEYSESGSPCLDTCTHTDTSSLCEEHKMDGCFCPPGTVFDDISERGCIRKEQCQCKHNKVYNTGEVLHKDDEECVCRQGRWNCKSLSVPGVCAIEEGSHFNTFDGKKFIYHGNCNYVLSKSCEDSKFIIMGQLMPCIAHHTDTCLKSIALLLNNDKSNALIIKDDGIIRHNGDIKLPYTTAEFTVFRPSSFHIMLQTTFGLQMQVQLVPIMQLYITLDQRFQGKTCGLCGNFNMVLCDDLMTPQGVVEGTATSFANSWKAQSNCPDQKERLDDPCSYSIDSESYAEHWCSKLKDKEDIFAKCHSTVNPENYYKRCKYSSCTCEKSEDCLCGVFSSYVRACAAKGVFLQSWRDTICEKYTQSCPGSQVFNYKVQQCQRTCDSLSLERQGCSTDYVPVDGCTCPERLYESENGDCVPMDKCSCYHNGEHIKPGKSINIKNDHCICTNGKLQCQSWRSRTTGCPAPKVFFNCSTAGPDEYGLECAPACAQKNIDCYLAECESGCKCPAGLLDDGRGYCVKEHECPCKHDNHFYAPGSQITDDCNKCLCKHGEWDCSKNTCPGTCTIYGSGHYNTFDKQRFAFSGFCSYIALQNNCGNKTGTFHVITENVPCGTTGTTCSKAVRIILGKTELVLKDGKMTEVSTVIDSSIKFNVRHVGLYLVIEFDIGLTVLWDFKTTVRIILQPNHKGEVCGLCGNYNGNGKDDFTTQDSLLVSDVLEFVNSWRLDSRCPDANPDFDPCVQTQNRHTWAKLQCSIIKSDTFKECHNKVEWTPYFDSCVKDSCSCDTGGDCECFCTAVAAYAQACNEAGVCVAWRTPEICPVFCDYYNHLNECIWHYSPCETPCYKTCLNPNGTCTNPLPHLEGCYPKCPEDKPIFDEKNQVCVEECPGCFINGVEYAPGDEIPTKKPCNLCYCGENGQEICFLKPGCCFYNGTEYNDTDIIYNVTDNMGTCYYAICINSTVVNSSYPCPITTTRPPTIPEDSTTPNPEPTTTPGITTESTTSQQTVTTLPPTVSTTTPEGGTTPKPTTTLVVESTTTPETKETTPVSTTTGNTTIMEPTPCTPICEWSDWINVYYPKEGDDLETYENIKNSNIDICEQPEDIQCRSAQNPNLSLEQFIQETGQVVQCHVSFGLVCEKKKQTVRPYKCFDYEIRVLCCSECLSTTTIISTTSPSSTTVKGSTTPEMESTTILGVTTESTTSPQTVTSPEGSTTPKPEATTTPGITTESTTSQQTVTTLPPIVSTTTPEGSTTPKPEPTTTPGIITESTTSQQTVTTLSPIVSTTTPKVSTTPKAEPTTTPGITTESTISQQTVTTPSPIVSTTTPKAEPTTTPGITTESTTSLQTVTTLPPIVSTTTPEGGTTPKPTTTLVVESTTTLETKETTPVSTTTGNTTIMEPTPCTPICEWSDWINVYYPKEGDDLETYENIKNSNIDICEQPEDIQCRSAQNPNLSLEQFIQETGQVVQCHVSFGLVCEKKKQTVRPYKCFDYEIRVLCCSECLSTTTIISTTSPSSTTVKGSTTPEMESTTILGVTTESTTSPQTVTSPEGSTTPKPEATTTPGITTESTTSQQTVTTLPPIVSTTTPEGSTTPKPEPTTTPGIITESTTSQQTVTTLSPIVSTTTPKVSTTPKAEPTTTPGITTESTISQQTVTTPSPIVSTTTPKAEPTTTPGITTESTTSLQTVTTLPPIVSTTTPEGGTTPKPTTTLVVESTTTLETKETTPVSTTTGNTTIMEPTPCTPICEWSDWINVYYPKEGDDLETYENIKNSNIDICEQPEDIQCRSAQNPNLSLEQFIQETGQVVQCHVSFGLVCEKKKQTVRPYKCFDYEIRVLCCSECLSTTTIISTTSPSSTTVKGSTTPEMESTTILGVTTESTTSQQPVTTSPPIASTTTPKPEPTTIPVFTTESTTSMQTVTTPSPIVSTTTSEGSTTPKAEPTTTPGITTESTTSQQTVTTLSPIVSTTTPKVSTTPKAEPTTTPGITTESTTSQQTVTTPSPIVSTTTPKAEPTTTPGITTESTTSQQTVTTPSPIVSTTTPKVSTTPKPEPTTTPGITTELTTSHQTVTTSPIVSTTTPKVSTTPKAEPTTTPGITTESTTSQQTVTTPPPIVSTTTPEGSTTPKPEPTTTPGITTELTTSQQTVTTPPPIVSTTTSEGSTTPKAEPTTTPGITTESTTSQQTVTTLSPIVSTTTPKVSTTPKAEPTTTPGITTESTTSQQTVTTPSPIVSTTTPKAEPTTTPGITTESTTSQQTVTTPSPIVSTTTPKVSTTPKPEPTTTPGITTELTTSQQTVTTSPIVSTTTPKVSTTPKAEPTTTPGITTESTTSQQTVTTPPPIVSTTAPEGSTTPKPEPTTTPGITTESTTSQQTVTTPPPIVSTTTPKVSTTPKAEPTTTPGITTESTTSQQTVTTPPPIVSTTAPEGSTTPKPEPTTTPGITTELTTSQQTVTTPPPIVSTTTSEGSTTPKPELTTTPGITTESTTSQQTVTTPPPIVSTTTPKGSTTPKAEPTTTPGITTESTTSQQTVTTLPPIVSTTTSEGSTTPKAEPTTTPGITTESTTSQQTVTTLSPIVSTTTPKVSTTPKAEPTTTPGITTESTTSQQTVTTPSPIVSTTTPKAEPTTTPGITTESTTSQQTVTTPSPIVSTTTPKAELTTTPGITIESSTSQQTVTTPPPIVSTTTPKVSTTPKPEPTTTPVFTTQSNISVVTGKTTKSTLPTSAALHPASTTTTESSTTINTERTSTEKAVSTTTECFCIINGVHYKPGEPIFEDKDIGSGVCLTMICSDICVIHNTTRPCLTIPPPEKNCTEWGVTENEIFEICNCTLARCIENNTIEIIPYECPPLQNITCSNGKSPVLVPDEYHCCEYYACDCFCEGWGDPHYITFDGRFYSYQGECTFVLMEEIRLKHHLKMYIDNVNCDPRESVSCPRAIIVAYNNIEITLKNHNLIGVAELEALMGNSTIKLPFAGHGLRVVSSGLNLILQIPQLNVVVTFGVTGFSVNLPFKYFGNNTQGHCGTCNNNRADDCMLPGGKLVEDCAIMANYWQAKDIYNPDCKPPPLEPETAAPTKAPCSTNAVCELLKSDLFKDCHPHISPENYFTGCQYDSCHMSNPAVVCTSIQTYAFACAQYGICINWRTHTDLCPAKCPAGKVYQPCGPVDPPTCKDKPEDHYLNVTTEGCFCPDGTQLFSKESGVCVDKCGCLDPSGQGREFGEKFQYGCEDCVCDEATVSTVCKPRQCSNSSNQQTCSDPGFIVVNVTDPSDACCTILTCSCESSTCPSVNAECPIGYTPVFKVPEGKCCAKYTCEPKSVCVHKSLEYEPGTAIPVVDCQECHCTNDVDPNTKLYKVRCGMVTCNEKCETGYGYVKLDANECCGKCEKTQCVLNYNDTIHILENGAQWAPSNNACDKFICTMTDGEYVTTNYKIQCPPFDIHNCQPGTVQLSADGCCQVCANKDNGCKVQTISDYITHNNCRSKTTVEQTHCQGHCNSYSKYTDLGSSSCSCCQASRSVNHTVTLYCVNGETVNYSYFHVEACNCDQTKCLGNIQSTRIEDTRRRRSVKLP